MVLTMVMMLLLVICIMMMAVVSPDSHSPWQWPSWAERDSPNQGRSALLKQREMLEPMGFVWKKRYFEKRFYTQNILHSKNWVKKDLVHWEVGADGFCLQKHILRNDHTHKTFFILKVGYGKNWSSKMLELIGFVCKWIFWETNLYNNLITIKTIETNDT